MSLEFSDIARSGIGTSDEISQEQSQPVIVHSARNTALTVCSVPLLFSQLWQTSGWTNWQRISTRRSEADSQR
jgi:hypothetical protein